MSLIVCLNHFWNSANITQLVYRSSTNHREIDISFVRIKNSPKMELRPRRSRKRNPGRRLPAVIRFPWYGLPLPVQHTILKELVGQCEGVSGEWRQSCAAYASVCFEWQKFFEKIVFKKFVLHESDLEGFERIVKRRTGSAGTRKSIEAPKRPKLVAGALSSTVSRMPRIQHIWLRVGLRHYGCPECSVAQSPKEVVR